MICTFFGHRDTPAEVRPLLRTVLLELIEQRGVDRFYVGCQGNFDAMARELLRELERSRGIRYEVVLAALPKQTDTTILKPDKIITTDNGLTIKQKIIPDSMLATKDVASWCKKGQKMKPCAKLNNGTGKPKGITVHNTADVKVAAGTNAAEQYTRATYNGNMSGVVVHFYVWDNEIWQNLREDERGWHAADGSTRRKSQRSDGSTIGGNLDTIAIECIGNRKLSEDTTAKLVAWLCKKHGLDPKTDIYTHKYFYPKKNCPVYILPHWNTFLSTVQKYYNALTGKAITPKAEAGGRTHTVKHGDTLWNIAKQYLSKGSRYTEIVKLNGLKSNVLKSGQVLQIPEK